jgi:hypothetical protein
MRHKASGPLDDLLHRIPRAAAHWLDRAPERVPVRAVAALAVALGLGIGGSVALASMASGPSSGPGKAAVDPARPQSAGPSPTNAGPATGEGSPAPGAPSTAPPPKTLPSAGQVHPPASPDPADATASASTGPETPSERPSEPSPDGSRVVPDRTPPDTSLSEEFPDSDAALFRLGADEAASFNCSLDGGAFKPCDSPTHLSDLKPGWHTFAVSAIDSAGNADPTPAETRWLANNGNAGDGSES